MDAYRRDLYWAQEYARRNRAVMMALLCRRGRGSTFPQVQFERADLVPPQLRGRGALRRGRRAGDPQGRDPGRAGATWASSRARWAPARTSCGGWATRTRSARPRTARGGGCRGRRRSGRSRVADLARADRRAWSAARTPGSSTRSPAPTRTSSEVIGAAGRPGRGGGPPQAGGLREGLDRPTPPGVGREPRWRSGQRAGLRNRRAQVRILVGAPWQAPCRDF